MRKAVNAISEAVNVFSKYLLIWVSGIFTVIVITQVVCRTFLQYSFVWADEISRYLLVWLTFVGASVAYHDNDMAALDIISSKVRENKNYQIIFQLTVAIVSLFIIVYGLNLCLGSSVRLQRSPSINLSMFWVYVSVPLGSLFFLVHSLKRLFEIFDKMRSDRRQIDNEHA